MGRRESNEAFTLVPSLQEFFGPPARRYVLRRSFAYWQAERRVFGMMMWGRPEEADVLEMVEAYEVGANPLFRGHTSLVDVRDLESVDLMSFETMLAHLKQRRDAWSPNVGKQVVLHRGGFAHAAVVGMFQFLKPAHPVEFCEDPGAAFEAVDAVDVRDEVEALKARLLGLPEPVRRLRAALDALPPDVAPAAIAKHLGTSIRSLQRRLTECGTSLRAEKQLHILRSAERLLETTELDLDALAARVGASSGSHLVTLFRQHHKTTPGAFRIARHRAQRPHAGEEPAKSKSLR
ncbi:AraC family transcriptional regulator [Labilithrix luteola]|uniref:AraC family transcriptional regulator n=1 Tax=Labilithrix luteola TaxID=1391654 RepID=UPI001474C49B|nr:helix-turn-helix domain-containing protein [Labilithrix luteola]